jgi:hypothetical protein
MGKQMSHHNHPAIIKPVKIPAIPRGDTKKCLTHLDVRLSDQKSPDDCGQLSGDEVPQLPYEEQMDRTLFGDSKPAAMAGLAAPQDIEIDRGSHGRVRSDGGD